MSAVLEGLSWCAFACCLLLLSFGVVGLILQGIAWLAGWRKS